MSNIPESNNPHYLVLRIIFICAAAVFILLAFNPLTSFYADVFSSLRIQMLIAALMCGGALMLLKLYKLSAVVILLCALGLGPILVSFPVTSPVNSEALSIKQINVNYSNKYLSTHLLSLRDENWDVLILQEFSDKNRHLLTQFITTTDMFGYEEVEGIPYGMVVLSRIPMVYKQQVKLDGDKLGYLKLKFMVGNTVLTTFIAHPPSPRSKRHWQNRNTLLAALKLSTQNEKGAWLVAGDLNVVPWSSYFEWQQAQTCFGQHRYSSFMPFKKGHSILTGLPIDHCVLSEQVLLQSLLVTDFKGSDHKMLSYKISLK